MKYVSNEFKSILNEQIRPATRLYFEVGIDDHELAGANPNSDLGFDTSVAPVVTPKDSDNQRYYAVLGDSVEVDDSNRICAPSDPTAIPPYSVPYGITSYADANTSVTIGDNTTYYYNFVGFPYGGTVCFLGGNLPTYFKLSRYDEEAEMWVDEGWQLFEPGRSIITFNSDPENAGDFRKFAVKGETGGRIQLSWTTGKKEPTGETPVIFKDELISNVNISQELDLTSQTLPDYSMTVECLDVDEIYKPDTEYWGNQFAEGSYCKLKLGYEINGEIEYIPMFYGVLTQAPTYSEGKITFRVEADINTSWKNDFASIPDPALSTGDVVDGILFKDYLENWFLFDSFDVFHGADDENDSTCNYYGTINSSEARQLIANALGCYITVGNNSIDLHNSNDIQYKTYEDYVTRWEQIQNTLESQPKVSKISITRNENTLSSNSVQKTLAERIYIEADGEAYGTYIIPFWAVGNFVVNDYDKTAQLANVSVNYDYFDEEMNEDGTVSVTLAFDSDRNTYVKPKVTFYEVDNKKYQETSYDASSDKGEEYTNDNDLITNSYTADKVKRVAHLINDTPNHYEVDVVQDYRYELGDVVRLETETNVFKTCVVTGLNFVLPGSSGHIACRKIFSLLDCPQAVIGAEGLTITSVTSEGDDVEITVEETAESGVVMGVMNIPADLYPYKLLFIVGATSLNVDVAGESEHIHGSGYLTDLNGHDWYFYEEGLDSNASIVTTAPIIQLPDYTDDLHISAITQGIVHLLQRIYEAQGMTAPVDYTCEYHPITP